MSAAFWQGKKASNPRPTVLETAALPAELFPYEIKLNMIKITNKKIPNRITADSIGKKSQELSRFRNYFYKNMTSYDVVDRQGLEPRTDRL